MLGTLSRDHEIFSEAAKHVGEIVITSRDTFRERHGPGALKLWRQTIRMWSSADSDRVYLTVDPEWAHFLGGCFEVVEIDEAHGLKNEETASHNAVQWLEAPFIAMATTASVLPNRLEDFTGYPQFIGMPDSLWEPDSLRRLCVTKNISPFNLADNHPAAILRLTPIAVSRFITAKKVNKSIASAHLVQVWGKLMVWATYTSPYPEFPDIAIG